MQFFPSGVSSKPALQMHWKLPPVLTQRPLRHITPFTMHSSISVEGSLTVSQVRYQSVSVLDTARRPTYPVYPYHPTVGIENDHGEWLEHTNAGLFGGGALVAFVTLAVVRPRCVDTVSIDTGVADALIHIWRRDERRRWREMSSSEKPRVLQFTNLNTPMRVEKG